MRIVRASSSSKASVKEGYTKAVRAVLSESVGSWRTRSWWLRSSSRSKTKAPAVSVVAVASGAHAPANGKRRASSTTGCPASGAPTSVSVPRTMVAAP